MKKKITLLIILLAFAGWLFGKNIMKSIMNQNTSAIERDTCVKDIPVNASFPVTYETYLSDLPEINCSDFTPVYETVLWERALDTSLVTYWEKGKNRFLTFYFENEKECKYQTIQVYESNEGKAYDGSVNISQYQNVLDGNGFRIEYSTGAAYQLIAYYEMVDGLLKPLVGAYNTASEVDFNEDGTAEIVTTYGTRPASYVYAKQGDEIMMCSINEELENYFSELYHTTMFSAVIYEEEENKFSYFCFSSDQKISHNGFLTWNSSENIFHLDESEASVYSVSVKCSIHLYGTWPVNHFWILS